MKKILILLLCIFIYSSCDKLDTEVQETNYKPVTPKAEYTKEKPGEWKGMEKEHLPVIRITSGDKINVIISVPLVNKDGKHYIETIGVMDESKKVIASKNFTRNTRYYQTGFYIPSNLLGKNLKVYVKCNLHDLWTAPLK